MAIIDRILVPTDFSNSSEKACRFAEKIASATNGVTDLLHVIPNTVLMDEQFRAMVKGDQDNEDEIYPLIFNEAELKLKSLSKNIFEHKNRGEQYVKVDRSPAGVIADQAWDGNYSVIVMSARGKDESKWFRGSTTEDVIRASKVPVLSVFDDAGNLMGGRIIVPVDGSILSMSATPAAAMLATIFNASITFLYIHEKLGFFGKHVPDTPDDVQSRRTAEYLMDQLMDFLDVMKPHELHVIDSETAGLTALVYFNQEVGIAFEVQSGKSAHHEITSYANRFADMVVMATHGRSGLAHILIGSNAEKVALNIKKTVLTIRPDSKLFENHNAQIPDS